MTDQVNSGSAGIIPVSETPEQNTETRVTEEQVLPLYSEDIAVSRRKVERNVQVHVRTVSHEHLIDEPLARERVEIERIAIGRPIEAIPPVREEGDITIIPVVEEIVVVERQLVLKEEIRLHRVRITEWHRETVTLREQQVVVERTGRNEHEDHQSPEPAPIPKPQALKE
jgi:uncharacterized protein (TIGR02271 family)